MTSDSMRYLPIFLKLDGEPCLVIGGGQVAERRARALLEAEARVTVVSPQLTPGLTVMSDEGVINHTRRRYLPFRYPRYLPPCRPYLR